MTLDKECYYVSDTCESWDGWSGASDFSID